MTDRERVALVAERVMGWAVNRSESGWHTVGVTPKRLIGPAKCRLQGDCWDPYERIDHAWEVVEKMKCGIVEFDPHPSYWEWGFQLTWIEDGDESTGWSCLLAGAESDLTPTAPEAICLAALRAKGVYV